MKDKQKPKEFPSVSLQDDFPIPTTEEWREAVDKLLKGKPYEKIMLTKTYEGIPLKPLYRKEDVESLKYVNELPGFGSFVRGTKSTGYRIGGWKIAQEIPESLPEKFNKALLHDLNRGQTKINIVLDSATLHALDPDHGSVETVGDTGLSVAHINDISAALNDVVLECIPLDIQAESQGFPLAALLIAYAKKQGNNIEKLTGCVGMDPIATLIKEGNLGYDISHAYDEMAALTKAMERLAPHMHTISITGIPYQEAGGSAVEELASVFATAVAYINALLERNLTIHQIAPRIQINLSLGANMFMEIAKIRAARLIWSTIIREYGGDTDDCKLYIHGRTSRYNKTIYDPYVNMLRTTTETFSGVVGGCDSVHVGAFDEVIQRPDEFSRRIARNQQIILQEECHFDQVIDPAGGSYYIEYLTETVAKTVWENFQSIQKNGGIIKALSDDLLQQHIAESATKRNKYVRIRKDVIVGTNMYANMQEKPLDVRSIDYDAIVDQRSRAVQSYRAKQNITLKKDSLFSDMVMAFGNGATLEQVTTALRKTYMGEEKIVSLPKKRRASEFEQLRKSVEIFARNAGKPKVFFANMGSVKQYKARSEFARGFFEVGAFDVISPNGFETTDAAATAAINSGASVMVICSTDATYPELVAPIVSKIKKEKPDMICTIAGYPTDYIDEFRAAGIDEFVYVRADILAVLTRILHRLEVL